MTQQPESDALEFTGERFTPECQREIWYEHYHRYALASRWCKGLRMLDAACGEGYGSALLAGAASSVEGVDISGAAVAHASQRYGHMSNLNFQVADCTSLPFEDDEFDCITSFETLEHLEQHDQLLLEFKRVLKPGGFLAISSPDKAIYTDKYQTENEFHVKELYRDEFQNLIGRYFNHHQLLGQKLAFHSLIWSMEAPVSRVGLDQVSEKENGEQVHSVPGSVTQAPMYFIALCADKPEDLPPNADQLWLFDDADEAVYSHYHHEIRHNIAAGGVIQGLEKQIDELKQQLAANQDQPPQRRSWWQRLFSKP